MQKSDIITYYLNNVLFSDNIYGIYNASLYFFNKKPALLTVDEAAMLVGLIQLPNKYNPYKNLAEATIRRDIVLKAMYKNNFLTHDELEIYRNIKLENKLKKNVIFQNTSYYNPYLDLIDTKTKYKSNRELNILVGDYNKTSVSNTTSVLESVGLNVTIANSGIEIIERIKNNERYDLIISNNIYNTGHCDGPETLMRLREIENFNIPVIVLTVSKGKRDMFVNGYGFDEYMEKILTQEKIKETLPRIFKNLEFTKIESNKSE